MGLDQYLYRLIDPSRAVDVTEKTFERALEEFGEIAWGDRGSGRDHAAFEEYLSRLTNIEQVTTWRKFNALHLWVERFAFGGRESNGDHILLTMDQLLDLMTACVKAMTDPSSAPEVLPTGSRFFFGSTDYDEWYFYDCARTATLIAGLVADEVAWMSTGLRARQFYYCSSW